MGRSSDPARFTVTTAIPFDVGHGRARVSGHHGLSLNSGDIVAIHGRRGVTAAVYWRSRPEDAGHNLLRVDAIIRKNAGIEVGEQVAVTKVDPAPCDHLVLFHVSPTPRSLEVRFENLVRRALNKRPVVIGDRIFIPGIVRFGEILPFSVVQTQPEGIVRITDQTQVTMLYEPADERIHASDDDE